MKTPAILFLLFFFSPLGLGAFFVCAQPTQPPLDSTALANAPTYTSIASALQAPDKDKVYKLNLSRQELKELPKEIVQFRNLQELNCLLNQLTDLPADIGKLTNLTLLYCGGNPLTTLPAEIGKLTSLRQLQCSNNQLTTLPAEIGNLTSLTALDCAYNQLTNLPAEIGKLTSLTGLYCYSNQLTSLPAEIGKLTSLMTLNCHGNQLTTLPIEIGNLTSLTELSCQGNQLTTLPAETGNLISLTGLYCYFNQLTTLPAEIGNLTSLTELNCAGNPFMSIPPILKDKYAFIEKSMESDIQNLHINPHGENLYKDFRAHYALDKSNLMRIDVYGAWWHNEQGHYPQAKAIIQDIFATLKKYDHKDSTKAKEGNRYSLIKIEGNAKSILQSIEKSISLLSAKEQAEIQTKTAEEQKKLAQDKETEATKAKKEAEKERNEAKDAKNQALTDKDKAKEAEKQANNAKKKSEDLTFWITVIGSAVVLIVLLFLAYFIASQRKANAQARLITEKAKALEAQQKITEEKNQELQALAEELRQQSEMVQEQRDDLIEKNNEMEALTEELRQQAETLEATNAEMQAMQQTKDLMISAVNHDLRNPLNPILNYSKAEYRGDKDERLAIIHDRAKMMFSLIGDIMDVYRADKLTVTPAVANAHKAASEAIHVITDAKTDLPAIINEVPEGLEGLFEYKYIERVLENILSNAVKYSDKAEEGGKVIVGAKLVNSAQSILKNKDLATHHAQFVRFSVADNGMGIPPEQFEAIFEPFTNPNARSIGSAKSVGIGLTFCKTIVEAHGSVIQIASVVGEGTTFSFDLPYSPPKVAETKATETKEEIAKFEALTAEEQASLADTIALLGTLDLCTDEMATALEAIDTAGKPNIASWKKALSDANDDYDEEAFKGLLV